MKKISKIFICLLLVFGFLPLFSVVAQEDKLSLSVTPPLFYVSLVRGGKWQGSVRVINPNLRDVAVYAEAVNFSASGEGGHGSFSVPTSEELRSKAVLASWISLPEEPIIIQKQGSAQIPLAIEVPESAPAGGHYAAILIRTASRAGESPKGSVISISNAVSSLIFARVEGEVVEEGRIREFVTDKSFYSSPEVSFSLRFENSGNVHLRPRGEIVIYNFLGKERGRIPVNRESEFGNVLPKSIRKFSFLWKGKPSIFEAGRYKAVVTLAYGESARQNDSRSVSFWIIPIAQIGMLAGIIAGFLFIIIFTIRLYIRKVVSGFEKELKSSLPEKEAQNKGEAERRRRFKKFYPIAIAILVAGFIVIILRLMFREGLETLKPYEIIIQKGNY